MSSKLTWYVLAWNDELVISNMKSLWSYDWNKVGGHWVRCIHRAFKHLGGCHFLTLSLLWSLSLIPADENIILLCEKEKVRIGTCLVDRLRCYYRKDCGREYMLMKLICSGKQNVQFSVFCKCAMFSESGDVCHPLLSLPVHDLYLTHCWWVTSTSWSYRPQFYADL